MEGSFGRAGSLWIFLAEARGKFSLGAIGSSVSTGQKGDAAKNLTGLICARRVMRVTDLRRGRARGYADSVANW